MDELKAAMLEGMETTGGNVSDACKLAGIDRRQYYRWRRQDPEFAARADDIREAMTDRVEARLMSLIDKGDANATMFYLKTRGKYRGYSTTMIRAGAMDGGADGMPRGVPPDESDLEKAADADRRCRPPQRGGKEAGGEEQEGLHREDAQEARQVCPGDGGAVQDCRAAARALRRA